MQKKVFIIIIIFLISVNMLIYCHPHLFIKPTIELNISEKMINSIKMKWEWDKWWSADVIDTCDMDGNGILNENEIKLVFKDFFNGIKDFHYFTEIFINGVKYKINTILNFHAFINKNNIVIYDFVIPLEYKIEKSTKIEICFNDETIYTAFDKNLNVKKNNNYQYINLKIENFSYYGVKISFDIH